MIAVKGLIKNRTVGLNLLRMVKFGYKNNSKR